MKLRNVIVMLVLAALAVLAFFALEDRTAVTGGKLLPPNFPKDFDPKSVSRVAMRFNDGSLTVRRRTDRSDAWEIESGTATVRADASVIEDLLLQIARQTVQNKLETAKVGGDLRGFGLAAPTAEIDLTVPGRVQKIRYGGTSAGTGDSVYIDEGEGTDLWLVSTGVQQLIANAVASGARAKRMTDMRIYDVGRVEIETGGVVRVDAERDATAIWRVKAPYKGYAHPTEFETVLSKLVNTEVRSWAELGAIDLKKYGLDAPAAEVRLHGKRGSEPVSILLGTETPEGVYAFEKGVPNIAVLSKDILTAALADPHAYRDRSFVRMGADSQEIRVQLAAGTGPDGTPIPAVAYELRKEGLEWDVVKPDRHKVDQTRVRDLIEMLLAWETKEFLDGGTPAECGIDGSSFIEIGRQGGVTTLLRLGRQGDSGTYWATRKDADGESGVERVDGAVVELLRKGYLQFRSTSVADFVPWRNEIERIERNRGTGPEGATLEEIAVSRDVSDGAKDGLWRSVDGPGVTGNVDQAAVNRFLDKVTQLIARGWENVPAERYPEVGFAPPRGETASFVIQFHSARGTPPIGDRATILVGKKREDGTYWARITNEQGWAFHLAEADLQVLLTPFKK